MKIAGRRRSGIINKTAAKYFCYSEGMAAHPDTYVALLRGINVGGKARVEMPRLKAMFEALGCEGVATYINSGNVIFRDGRPAAKLVSLIEAAIRKEFGLTVPVVLRDLAAIEKLCREIPAGWTNDSEQKTDVLFLWDEIDGPDIMKKITVKPEIENARYVAGALVWNIGRRDVTRGSGVKLIQTDLYRHMTARNINTVRKLYALMQAA
jgi:uncharacterized protein (DUF1697 family)